MFKDTTATWKADKTRFGVYIVRSMVDGATDRVRIGVGGIRGGKTGIVGRLGNHLKGPPKTSKYETHSFQPYEVVKVWALEDFSAGQLEDAEICLYRAFLTRFPRHVGPLRDKSLFVVPDGFDFREVVEEFERDLQSLEAFRLKV